MSIEKVMNQIPQEAGAAARATASFIGTKDGLHSIAEVTAVALSALNHFKVASIAAKHVEFFETVTCFSHGLGFIQNLTYLTPRKEGDDDATNIASDFEKQNRVNIAAKIALMFSVQAGCGVLFLGQMGVKQCAGLAARYGISTAISGGVAILMVKEIVESSVELYKGNEKRKNMLNVASAVGELAASVILIAGLPPGAGYFAAAGASAGFGFLNGWLDQLSEERQTAVGV